MNYGCCRCTIAENCPQKRKKKIEWKEKHRKEKEMITINLYIRAISHRMAFVRVNKISREKTNKIKQNQIQFIFFFRTSSVVDAMCLHLVVEAFALAA